MFNKLVVLLMLLFSVPVLADSLHSVRHNGGIGSGVDDPGNVQLSLTFNPGVFLVKEKFASLLFLQIAKDKGLPVTIVKGVNAEGQTIIKEMTITGRTGTITEAKYMRYNSSPSLNTLPANGYIEFKTNNVGCIPYVSSTIPNGAGCTSGKFWISEYDTTSDRFFMQAAMHAFVNNYKNVSYTNYCWLTEFATEIVCSNVGYLSVAP